MSVEYSAVICRGFVINECPYDKWPDEFIDEWVICFDGWNSNGPYIVGYRIKEAREPGLPYDLGCTMGDPLWDDILKESCKANGIEPGPIKTYFGVRVS